LVTSKKTFSPQQGISPKNPSSSQNIFKKKQFLDVKTVANSSFQVIYSAEKYF